MTTELVASAIAPGNVHDELRQHMLVDGYHLVFDTKNSHGSWLVDAATGETYLDLFTFFASAPLGSNPPGVTGDPEFMALLAEVAANKPANSDIYSTHMAEFVDTFARVLGDPDLPHLFFVEGGGLAVENALKVAFDWKSRHNEANGRSRDLGTKVIHLTHAFHGRTGYTMSLTNTDPNKTDRFPKFDWPRIDTPAIRFPLEDNLAAVEAAEARALDQIRAAFAANPHDIACFLAEPIQSEGGDIHLRAEFLQAVQQLCHDNDALFILDEVQTGVGMTGTTWAYQQLGLKPDVVAFAKKVQLGGIMAGGRLDEVADNVFAVSSRINSTWGGGLVDMVRSRRNLEIIERDGLIAHVAGLGPWLLGELRAIQAAYPELVSNARGRGLLCAIDLPDPATRTEVLTMLRDDEHVLALACGDRSIRLRPALSVTQEELQVGLDALGKVLGRLGA